MFDGVPDQLHQFIGASSASARTTTTLLLPLSFTSSNGFTSFDPLFTSSSNSHHQQVSPQLHHHHHHHQQQQQPQFLQSLHQQKNNEESTTSLVGMNMEINGRDQRSIAEPIDNLHHHHHPWSNDEVLALLRVRSSIENWFPEFTWEHVSRKLADLGFKRSADKCKEKFEEESRYFNSINCIKNYRIFNELEELYQAENPPPPPPPPPPPHHSQQQQVAVVADENNKNVEKSREDEDNMGQNLEADSRNIDELYQTSPANNTAISSDQDNIKVVENKANYDDNKAAAAANNKKRKRVKKLELFKGFCEDMVHKLMIQQEEMHNKLIEDMVKRDEEKVAREEAWKKQELDRINQELELRAKEQAIAGDRQATIIKFLSKFSQTGSSKKQCFGRVNEDVVKVPSECSNPPIASSSPLVAVAENPNPIVTGQNKVDQVSTTSPSSTILAHQNKQSMPISMTESQAPQNPNPETPDTSSLAPQNPNSVSAESNPLPPTSPLTVNKAPQNPTCNEKEDLGKRWPRDEVLALINLRCSLYNNGDHEKEGTAIKAPLWERISQGMLELGYKRSAKRCKEKWENINKYFRKTKDINKKRSLDSRTCPYFHQLNTLYSQGTLIAPSDGPENRSPLPENHSKLPETGKDSSQRGDKDSTVHVSGGNETNMVQLPGFEFEF
ncbi:hypothetical protein CXB51_028977 [Gossypium anomalum]|uniref:Myb-like domain-containing protein n=1 Tax=Gossypium anomalum TaxID=47600 RepID=A0A8J5YZJ3_9ROSI|nr:hypothetical protein CXB51_028977 [Gossypium anomalum]